MCPAATADGESNGFTGREMRQHIFAKPKQGELFDVKERL